MKNNKVLIAVIIVIVVAGAIFFVTRGKKTETPTGSSTSSTPSDQTKPTKTVSIKDLAFSPATLTVKKGTKVTWVNDDSPSHTVTANDKSFDSGTLKKDGNFSFTFDNVGSFPYSCTIHPSMKATIVVQE